VTRVVLVVWGEVVWGENLEVVVDVLSCARTDMADITRIAARVACSCFVMEPLRMFVDRARRRWGTHRDCASARLLFGFDAPRSV